MREAFTGDRGADWSKMNDLEKRGVLMKSLDTIGGGIGNNNPQRLVDDFLRDESKESHQPRFEQKAEEAATRAASWTQEKDRGHER